MSEENSSPKTVLLKTLQDTLNLKIEELGKLVESLNSAKSKTKKQYFQKKVNTKRDQVLKYMFEVEKIRKNINSGEK